MKFLIFNQFLKFKNLILKTKKLPISKFTIQGTSMLPTLHPGATILASSLPYLFTDPKINDIVVCLDPRGGRALIKRIAKISKSEYFVIGDNPEKSTDSREFGMIQRQAILGKMIFFSTI